VKLEHEFVIPADIAVAWKALINVDLISLSSQNSKVIKIKDGVATGEVKVKLGPMSMTLNGAASILEQDNTNHFLELSVSGFDSAETSKLLAIAQVKLEAINAERTTVHISIEIEVTGKPAAFGQTVVSEVCNRFIKDFLAGLSAKISSSLPGK
jgi:carbon monoxide dehydrogenase subunit G